MDRGALSFLGLLLAALPGSPATAAPPTCGVMAGDGEIRTAPAAWQPLLRGAALPARAEVRASRGFLKLCLAKGAVIELAPGSSADLLGEIDVPVNGGARVGALGVALREGEVAVEPFLSRWSGPLTRPLLVRGPGATQALHLGGGLRARVAPAQGSTSVALVVGAYLGDSLTSAGHDLRPLRAGHVVELRSGLPTGQVQSLTPAPAWLADDGPRDPGLLAVVGADDATATVAARFSPVPGAVAYEAEIARDPGFTEVVARLSLAASETTVISPALPVGRYMARVSARGTGGLRGLPGPNRSLRVLRATLPTGGELASGVAVLPPHRTLRLEDAEGLELALGVGPFAKPPAAIGLDGGEQPVSARLRLVGEGGYLPLSFTRMAIHVDVEMGPKTAMWPRDPVWIQVRTESRAHALVDYEPEVRVTVNLQETAVSWQRGPGLLRASLPPQTGPGPWVVRVEAKDRRSKELGFGSLEVVRGK
jgi:hypothetical protein